MQKKCRKLSLPSPVSINFKIANGLHKPSSAAMTIIERTAVLPVQAALEMMHFYI